MKLSFLKKSFITLLFILFLPISAYSQAGTKFMLEENSVFALQNVPIKEGVDVFQTKLNKIKEEQNREPLGLVLSGGSARAFAHIGALKAMEENQITPDFIVANSMGAIIGLLYAYGFNPDTILQIIQNINLTEFFDPVLPVKGGILSVRNFSALIKDLTGIQNADLQDCPIPIIILTEDLYTKRQIWHAKGDFATIMAASFSMPVIMEPVKTNLTENDQNSVILVDSGTIDIAGLSIAESFTNNIIISTALYEPTLDYNNPIVVLNRTTSIGKERQAIKDIKTYKPVIIKNDVENYSFMAFDKVDELTQIGYNSTKRVMDEILKCPHSFTNFEVRHIQTDSYANATITKYHQQQPFSQKSDYLGIKIWPSFPVIDYPDYFLYDKTSLSSYVFYETSKIYTKLGLNFPFTFNDFSTDALFRFNPSSILDASIFGSYSFSYNTFKPSSFYGAATIKLRPSFFPYSLKSLLTTAEYSADNKFLPNNIFIKTGPHLQVQNKKKAFLLLKPYYFISGQNFTNLSQGVGTTFQTSINNSAFSSKTPKFAIGISDNFSFRYAFAPLANSNEAKTQVLSSDFYRATKPADSNNFIFSNAAEIYFTNLDPNFTFAELVILQQLNIGPFYDICYNGTFNQATGVFARAQISFIGLCNFIFEGGCGWNLNNNSLFGFFQMKSHM